MLASGALELCELVEDKEDKKKYLEKAQTASGNALDVKEICAVTYVKLDMYDEAGEIFKMLINEGFNPEVNTQLLSAIYSYKYDNPDIDAKTKGKIEKEYGEACG